MIPARNIKSFSYFKIIIIWTFLLILGTGGYFLFTYWSLPKATISTFPDTQTSETPKGVDEQDVEEEYAGITTGGLNPEAKEKAALTAQKEPHDPADKTKNFNILVLGIDRRYAAQTSWRTDVIQLITISADRTRAVVTHIPRDVWAGNYKINSIYNLKGPDAIKDEVENITGQRPDRLIRVDFDAFVYAVDAAGGVSVNNPNEFIDASYPNDRKGKEELIEVEFSKGEQVLDGERALQFVRSRKGTNGEGSDYARGIRQQLVMKSILSDYFKPNNMFNPKTAETLFNIASKNIYTDISLKDTQVLYALLQNFKTVKISSLGLDTSNYLTVPSDRSAYGGAWTLVPKTDYKEVHNKINELLK